MKKASEIYENFCGMESDYMPMLDEFGKIEVLVEDNDFQGDSKIIYSGEKGIGYLTFGWGSCSGCDALQGCKTIEELQDLMDELKESIIWFKNKKEAIEFLLEHDWQGDYDYSYSIQKEFIDKALNFLKGN